MRELTSSAVDDGLQVDVDHDSQMEDAPLEIDSSPEDVYEHPFSAESDAENSTESSRSPSDEDLIEDVFENGRRYCNSIYFMPNDEPEQTRLSILHQIYLIILDGKLTKAPLNKNVERILDVGTGPGDWACAIGEQYPNAEVIATDISVFDDVPDGTSPPNVSFEVDDAEGEWAYDQAFDLIHFRGLSGAISDWPALYRQALTHLKPGGYIEVTEFDLAGDRLRTPNASPNSYLNIYISAIRSAAEAAGYPRNMEHMRPAALSAAGFESVQTHDIDVPVGTWPHDPPRKTLGKMTLICLLEGLEAIGLRQLTRREGWTAESVRDLCDKVKEEMVSQKSANDTVRFVVARKPSTESQCILKRKRKQRKKKKNNKNNSGNQGSDMAAIEEEKDIVPNGHSPEPEKNKCEVAAGPESQTPGANS